MSGAEVKVWDRVPRLVTVTVCVAGESAAVTRPKSRAGRLNSKGRSQSAHVPT